MAYTSGSVFFTGYFGYGKRRGGCHLFCVQGVQSTRRHAESVRPQQSAGKIREGWLACLPMET